MNTNNKSASAKRNAARTVKFNMEGDTHLSYISHYDAHRNSVTLTVTKIDKADVSMPEHTVTSAYVVHDQHQRRAGYLVRAQYEERGDRSLGWHFVVSGNSSIYFFATQAEALDNMAIAWAGKLAASSDATFTVNSKEG